MFMKKVIGFILMGSMVLLSACSEDKQNPLTRQQDADNRAAAASFLFDISQQAITQLNEKEPGVYGKKAYQRCMNDPTGFNLTPEEHNSCGKVFSAMAEIAHHQKSPYKKVTSDNISDQTMWLLLSRDYFSHWNKK